MCDDLECVVSYARCGPSVRRLWQGSPGLLLEPLGVWVGARVALFLDDLRDLKRWRQERYTGEFSKRACRRLRRQPSGYDGFDRLLVDLGDALDLWHQFDPVEFVPQLPPFASG